jgi:hypothetical protein
MYTEENEQADNEGKAPKSKLSYAVYRPFLVKRGTMAFPGDTVLCTEVEAMCINTMRPMTLRSTDVDRQNR